MKKTFILKCTLLLLLVTGIMVYSCKKGDSGNNNSLPFTDTASLTFNGTLWKPMLTDAHQTSSDLIVGASSDVTSDNFYINFSRSVLTGPGTYNESIIRSAQISRSGQNYTIISATFVVTAYTATNITMTFTMQLSGGVQITDGYLSLKIV